VAHGFSFLPISFALQNAAKLQARSDAVVIGAAQTSVCSSGLLVTD